MQHNQRTAILNLWKTDEHATVSNIATRLGLTREYVQTTINEFDTTHGCYDPSQSSQTYE